MDGVTVQALAAFLACASPQSQGGMEALRMGFLF